MNLNESILSRFKISKSIELKNKILMAPMTRRFADTEFCPTPEVADYYAKRSDAGLIVTEGTIISEDAIGYGNVPGIYTDRQISKWSKVTEKVHINNGKIFLQLWHCGRVSHSKFHNGNLPVSCSETEMKLPLGKTGLIPGKCRAASVAEIEKITVEYSIAAKNAIKAGFDGIEIHAANGYLIDQFLHYCANLRDDSYGASPENMSRFCIDIVKSCIGEIGNDKIGLRISPGGHMAEIQTHQNDKLVFEHLLKKVSELNIAYVHIGSFDDSVIFPELNYKTMTKFVREIYSGNLVACGGYSIDAAHEGILSNQFDLVAFGRNFISGWTLVKFKDRVRQITKGHRSQPLIERINNLNIFVRGWTNYFQLTKTEHLLKDLDSWIRQRLRMCLIKQWRRPRARVRNMMKLGATLEESKEYRCSKRYWYKSKTKTSNVNLNNEFFIKNGYQSVYETWIKCRKIT